MTSAEKAKLDSSRPVGWTFHAEWGERKREKVLGIGRVEEGCVLAHRRSPLRREEKKKADDQELKKKGVSKEESSGSGCHSLKRIKGKAEAHETRDPRARLDPTTPKKKKKKKKLNRQKAQVQGWNQKFTRRGKSPPRSGKEKTWGTAAAKKKKHYYHRGEEPL